MGDNPSTESPKESVRILIAEPSEGLGDRIVTLACSLGLDPIFAPTGQEALTLFRRRTPSICFVDVLLENPDGFAVCHTMKEQAGGRAVYVVMMSSLLTDSGFVADDLERSGADDFLPRNFSTERLRAILQAVVPVVHPSKQPPSRAQPSESGQNLQPMRMESSTVLIITDQTRAQARFARWIEARGLRPVVAPTPDDALQLFQSARPSLCLIDLELPHNVGLELCRSIKAQPRGGIVPVVAMSAHYFSPSQLLADTRSYGVDDGLCKPFTQEKFGALLERYLSLPSVRINRTSNTDGTLSMSSTARGLLRHLDSLLEPQGLLDEVDVSALIYKLRYQEQSGTLTLEQGNETRTLVFLGGRPIWVNSQPSDETLDNILIRRGDLLREDVLALYQEGILPDQWASAIAERELVSPERLALALQEQMRLRALTCFLLGRGTYSFVESTSLPSQEQPFFLNPLMLLREGSAQLYSNQELADHLRPYIQSAVLKTSLFAEFISEFPANNAEKALLSHLEQSQTLLSLMQLRLLEVNHFLGLIWGLYQARMIIFDRARKSLDDTAQIKIWESAREYPPRTSAWKRLFPT